MKEFWNSNFIMALVIESTLLRQTKRLSSFSVAEIKVPKIKILQEHNNSGRIFKRDAMTTHKSYKSYLIESLKDPAEAAAYLDVVSATLSILYWP
jgi:hypothetical protein